jgi:hypothetical protein
MAHVPHRTSAMAVAAIMPACVEALDKPDPPDMDAIIALYTSPTAELSADNIDALQRELSKRFLVLRDLCSWEERAIRNLCTEEAGCYLCSGLTPLHETFQALSDDSDDSEDVRQWLRGLDGFLRVTRICRGWGAEPTGDLENGTIELAMGFNAQGFDPIFGGQIIDCHTLFRGVRVTLEGDLDLAFERRFGFRELPRLDPIVQVRGRATLADGETVFQAHFRVSALGGADLALGFEVDDDGTMVASTGSSGLGVQAANGRFSCELSPPLRTDLQCRNVETGELVP